MGCLWPGSRDRQQGEAEGLFSQLGAPLPTCSICGIEGELLHGNVWNLVVMSGHKNSFRKRWFFSRIVFPKTECASVRWDGARLQIARW